MGFTVLDTEELLGGQPFTEDHFLEVVEKYDWTQFAGVNALVRGCGSTIIPPWAFMIITSKLSQLAKSIRYGNEHDNITVFRRARNT